MTAVAWTAIGLLAATPFGSLYYLGSKIDSLAARVDSRLDALTARLDTHLERHAG